MVNTIEHCQLNPLLLHSPLDWQLPITEHVIDRHGGRLWEYQRPLDKPHDDKGCSSYTVSQKTTLM